MVEDLQKLTPKQNEIYILYYIDNLTQDLIASRLKTSQQAISKLLRKINKRLGLPLNLRGGCIKGGMVKNTTPIKQPSFPMETSKYWRIHGLHFIIKPFYFQPRYYKIMKERGNYGIKHKDFTLMLYEDSVRIQSGENISFDDPDKYKAIRKAEGAFNAFLAYAAETYGFSYEKEGRVSIRLINSHLALNGSEVAQATDGQYIGIRNKEGKVYFIIDKSKGEEHEYIGKRSFEASERIEPYFNDFLYNQPLTNSQLTSRFNDVITALEKITVILKNNGGLNNGETE